MIEIPDLIAEYRRRQLTSPAELAGGRALLGFDPPCDASQAGQTMEARLKTLHEAVRGRLPAPARFDARAAHLVLLAMLVKDHGADALAQAVAARRHGATWDDIRCVAGLAFALFGNRAAHRGEELLQALADWEQQDRIEGAVAAYG